jgi:adenosylmethionine-8-amino-7-oxononanoate aminotransferase
MGERDAASDAADIAADAADIAADAADIAADAADIAARARRAIWHPFTQMSEWLDGCPVVIERGEGNDLIDTEGNRYLDGISSMWVNLHGHDHPHIVGALHRQLDTLAHSTLLGLSSRPPIELALRLVAIAPRGLAHVFFSDNGSTAMEIAIKIAFQYWQQRGEPARQKFVSLRGAYHGDTLGAVAIGGIESFHARFGPLLFDVYRAENAHCYRCPHGLTHPSCEIACLRSLESILAEHGAAVAGVVVEPLVQAAAGMLLLPPGWLRRARELCDRHGTLLIVDEVATGFGRTGRMFACDHEHVTPDLMALAKGLTAGFLPLAATLATDAIFQAFLGPTSEGRQLFHGHSYTGNALGCAAALANLDIFEREDVLGRVRARAAQLAERLTEVARLPHVGEIRQRGLMVGIELVQDRATRAPFALEERVGHWVCMAMRQLGIVLRPLGDTVVLMPPLSILPSEVDRLVDGLLECIPHVTGA